MNKLKIWPIAYCENEGLISEDLLPAFTEVRVITNVRGPSRWRTDFASGLASKIALLMRDFESQIKSDLAVILVQEAD